MQKWSIVTLNILLVSLLFITHHSVFAKEQPNTVRIHFDEYSFYDYLSGKNWSYCYLKSEDGTDISLDYQICPFPWGYPEGHYSRALNREITAPRIWFNVRNKDFTGNENVSVVFIKKYLDRKRIYDGDNWRIQESVTQLDLNFIAGEYKFTADLNNVFIAPFIDYNLIHEPNWQEIAIQVDGKWLKDPISQTHNFRVDLLHSFKK